MRTRGVDVGGRQVALVQRRRLKMAASAHAYVRGNTVKFYEWLEGVTPAKVLPEGPPVWICGDCHIGNLGPVANAKGKVKIQIRDLDQTVIGNPVHDLVRLSLSLAMAARSSDLPGVTTALMIEQVVAGYTRALLGRAAKVDHEDVTPVRLVMRQAVHRRWRHLAEERLEDVTPQIPLGRRFWQLSEEERREIEELFAQDRVRGLATCLKARDEEAQVEVVDAAYWMKGCSSLGRLRYAVLLGIGKKHRGGYCLVDLKEAVTAAAPRDGKAEMPRGNAERVVAGAKALSPFLGKRMLAASFNERPVVMRELMPQDLKFEMEGLTPQEAVAAAHLFAGVVGKAHGRQMKRDVREAWAGELGRTHTKTLEAPSWLWASVVELVASHEAAYLHHCRTYALGRVP